MDNNRHPPSHHVPRPYQPNQSRPLYPHMTSPFSLNESNSNPSNNQPKPSSSSLYPSAPIGSHYPHLSLDDENVYRGVDLSTPMLQTPVHTVSQNARHVSFEDFDQSFHQIKVNEPKQSNLLKKELSLQSLGSLSSISALASLEARPSVTQSAPKQPLTVHPAPSYVEPYTSIYSRASPQSLVDCVSAFFAAKSVDYEFNAEKCKFRVSFLCPVFSFLSITFNIRLYSTPKDRDLIVCEFQRRDGCVMGFNCIYSKMVNHIKQASMFAAPYTACQFGSQSESTNAGVRELCTLPVSMNLDDQAFNLLVSLVRKGDSIQQAEAVRILGQCLNSPLTVGMSSRLPVIIQIIHSTLITQVNNAKKSFNEEKAAQITHLVAALLSSPRSTAVDRAATVGLIQPMITLLAVVLADINLTKLKIVRFIMETLNSLTVDRESLDSIKPLLNDRDLRVLQQCSVVCKDNEVARLASAVSQRLAAV